MKQFTYKCVRVPNSIELKGKFAESVAATEYEKIINDAAEGGWELSHIDSIVSVKPAGCLSFSNPEKTVVKMLIFRKEVSE